MEGDCSTQEFVRDLCGSGSQTLEWKFGHSNGGVFHPVDCWSSTRRTDFILLQNDFYFIFPVFREQCEHQNQNGFANWCSASREVCLELDMA